MKQIQKVRSETAIRVRSERPLTMAFAKTDPTSWVAVCAAKGGDLKSCPVCKKSMTGETKKDHFERNHFEDGRSLPCGLCKNSKHGEFKTAYTYSRHVLDMHSGVKDTYRCNWENCTNKKGMRDRRDVYKHIAAVHGQTRAECPRCKEDVIVTRFVSHNCSKRSLPSDEIISSDDDFVEEMPKKQKRDKDKNGKNKSVSAQGNDSGIGLDHQPQNQEGHKMITETVVPVPFEFHRCIIGAKGSEIRSMMDRYDVNIKVPPSVEQSNAIIISGAAKKVETARQAVVSKVVKLEMEKAEKAINLEIFGRKAEVIQQSEKESVVDDELAIPGVTDKRTIAMNGLQDDDRKSKDANFAMRQEFVSILE